MKQSATKGSLCVLSVCPSVCHTEQFCGASEAKRHLGITLCVVCLSCFAFACYTDLLFAFNKPHLLSLSFINLFIQICKINVLDRMSFMVESISVWLTYVFVSMQYKCIFFLNHYITITESVVLWKIQKFDWLIPETKWLSCLHNSALCSYLATLRLLRQRENNPQFSGTY